jgi:hypothetical protein
MYSADLLFLLGREGELEGIGHKSCPLCKTADREMNECTSGREGV